MTVVPSTKFWPDKETYICGGNGVDGPGVPAPVCPGPPGAEPGKLQLSSVPTTAIQTSRSVVVRRYFPAPVFRYVLPSFLNVKSFVSLSIILTSFRLLPPRLLG